MLNNPQKKSFYDKYGYDKLRGEYFSEGGLIAGYRFGNNPQ